MRKKKHPIKTVLKWLFRAGLLLVLLFLVVNAEIVVYGIRQLTGQIHILWAAKPVAEYLNDPAYPDSLKTKLVLIREIKQFTIDSIGLDPSGSYEKMFDQQGKPILWVVTACQPFALTEKEWAFPLFGTFSYKGYFSLERAEKEAEALKAEGWDTDIGEVSAWSTLGFLNDPVLSGMLRRPPGSLANLIIHELTHGTIFIKNNITYNENLADFVGDEGATRFLVHKYGEGSKEHLAYQNSKEDYATFSRYVLACAQRLDSLYQSFTPGMTQAGKQLAKADMISALTVFPDSVQFHNPRYRTYFEGDTPNNTFFMAYKRYREQQNQFRKEFETRFQGDLRKYVAYLKEKYPSFF